ncbi:SDR family NAD(P)-dependent oxidoreductase [Streptomyces sp. NPDC056660]|uniref:SDR family NAD(P)-dependent oxidoreductase n=1 Tax=Streptomyces sp. NPDC056660 TaxID=3345897 RepID=UPI003676A6C5
MPEQPEGFRELAGPGAPSGLFDLTGRVALVTGGSRGLGREMVLAFAEAGASVVITSRRVEACRELAREVSERTGRAALAYGCHMGRWDELDGLVEAAYERFGQVDVLVNNAGMSVPYDRPTDVTEKMWDSVVGLNLKGPFRLTALIGSRMAEQSGGSIINVSSTGSIRPTPGILPYAAAKSGLNALTEGFARAFGPTVRVNCLMAGPFFTDVSKAWDLPAVEQSLQQHALRRGGRPEEIIGAALFLASDASSYTTGAILRADGGIP